MRFKILFRILFIITFSLILFFLGDNVIGKSTNGPSYIASNESNEKKETPIIQIGENKQVSKTFFNIPHYGVNLAINLLNPNNLLSTAVIFSGQSAHSSVVAYTSLDGGESWEMSPIFSDVIKQEAENPILAFGLDNTVYFSYLNKDESYRKNFSCPISLLCSEDGGKTWSKRLKQGEEYTFDWHNLLVDQTSSKYANRFYLIGTKITKMNGHKSNKKLLIYYSIDKGLTFIGPVAEIDNVRYFNGAILSDGTLIILYTKSAYSNTIRKQTGTQDILLVVTSHDGGESFSSPVAIAKINQEKKAAISTIPSLAVDTSSGPFKDRIYVAWLDAQRGCYDIYLSWSSNKGRNWSSPIMVNDNPPPVNPFIGPDHTCPGVAANKDGVVGVLWYDRRDDGANIKSMTWDPSIKEIVVEHDNRWQIYFSASLDGGESFLANLKVSRALFSNNAPNNWVPIAEGEELSFYLPQNRYPGAGKVGSFAASSDGIFHASWVDSRSGVSQIWTAPIQVNARAFPNGSKENADLEDISSGVKFEISNTRFIPRDKVIEFDVRLRNIAEDQTFIVPFKVRLLGINSEFGSWEVLESDNKIKGVGAIWDFANLIPNGRLEPGEISDKKQLSFKLKDEILPNYRRLNQFLNLRTKILGKRKS